MVYHENESQKIVRSILKSEHDELQMEILLKVMSFQFCNFYILKGLFGREIHKCYIPQWARHVSWLTPGKKLD